METKELSGIRPETEAAIELIRELRRATRRHDEKLSGNTHKHLSKVTVSLLRSLTGQIPTLEEVTAALD